MDSNVAAVCGAADVHAVRIVLRAQAKDFPSESESELFDRARSLAGALLADGYREVEVAAVPVTDPVNSQQVLDTWYEVTYEKPDVPLAALGEALRAALGVQKTA